MREGTATGTESKSARAQADFYELADHLSGRLRGDEVFTATFGGEDSEFARINGVKVRQAGAVAQRTIEVDLILGERHASGSVSLSGVAETDRGRLDALVESLRDKLPHLPEDPHLLYSTEVRSSEQHGEDRLPDAGETVAAVLDAARGKDLVGIWASGGVYSGFANSLGQRNWFSSATFNLDWSLYHQADKAVKTTYAGFEWDAGAFEAKLATAVEQLAVLAQPARTIEPGRYRVYLSPVAISSILGTLCWGGFGMKDHRTKQTSLLKMVEDDARLHPSVSLIENTCDGVAANFQKAGFLKPDEVRMIDGGAFRECLTSPRSAKEYGVETNGASDVETPSSLDMAAGALPTADVLRELDTGLYLNNLWYLNYSDTPACRMTGMTRFACFQVESGRIQAPLNVMRFDETIYRVLGENLLGLTAEREMLLDADTYYARSTSSMRVPGALVEDFNLTL